MELTELEQKQLDIFYNIKASETFIQMKLNALRNHYKNMFTKEQREELLNQALGEIGSIFCFVRILVRAIDKEVLEESIAIEKAKWTKEEITQISTADGELKFTTINRKKKE